MLLHMSPSFRAQISLWSSEGCPISESLLIGRFVKSDVADYLSIRDGMISFLPHGKDHAEEVDGTWLRKNRQVARPSKIVRSLLTDARLAQLSDADFEAFANRIKAQGERERGDFRIVSGADIKFWYHGNQYANSAGTLSGSCMMHDKCQNYFGLYLFNTDVCRLVILVNKDSQLVGRALLWTDAEGRTLMDRIYGSDATIQAFREHARDQGWHYRAFNTYERETQWMNDGQSIQLKTHIDVAQAYFGAYPYMDTFKYLDLEKKQLHNTYVDGCWELCSTSGGPKVEARVTCAECLSVRTISQMHVDENGQPTTTCNHCWNERHCRHCSAELSEGRRGRDYCAACEALSCGRCGAFEDAPAHMVDGWCRACAKRFACATCGTHYINARRSLIQDRSYCNDHYQAAYDANQERLTRERIAHQAAEAARRAALFGTLNRQSQGACAKSECPNLARPGSSLCDDCFRLMFPITATNAWYMDPGQAVVAAPVWTTTPPSNDAGGWDVAASAAPINPAYSRSDPALAVWLGAHRGVSVADVTEDYISLEWTSGNLTAEYTVPNEMGVRKQLRAENIFLACDPLSCSQIRRINEDYAGQYTVHVQGNTALVFGGSESRTQLLVASRSSFEDMTMLADHGIHATDGTYRWIGSYRRYENGQLTEYA